MQPILITTKYPDLYRLLAAMAETSYSYLSEPKLAAKSHEVNTILIWSPEPHSNLLDSCGKLEVIEIHARRLGVGITLSAAANPQLQEWGRQLGWNVLWNTPALDYKLAEIYSSEEAEEAIAC